MLFLQADQPFLAEILFILDGLKENIRSEKLRGVIFCLALFAQQKQSPLTHIKVRTLQSLLNKCGLSRLQEACKQIYRYFHTASFVLLIIPR